MFLVIICLIKEYQFIYKKIYIYKYAYCRYVHIWTLLYFLNIFYFSPLITYYIILIIHSFNIEFNSKKICFLIQDILLIYLIYKNNKKYYLIENIFVFIIYLLFLKYKKINLIKLYTKYIKLDDIKHKNETFFKYNIRIWKLFFKNIILSLN